MSEPLEVPPTKLTFVCRRSAIQQVAMHSKLQVTKPAPLRSSSRLTGCVKHLTDMVFDSCAPHTSPSQREHFLSLVTPLTAAGIAVVVHAKTELGWHVPSLWAVIVVLAARIFWLQAIMPSNVRFSDDNAIILLDLHGEKITIPFQFCLSLEVSG